MNSTCLFNTYRYWDIDTSIIPRQVSGGRGVVHIVEHVPSHLPVLVGGGVGQHRPHQHDGGRQKSNKYAEQGPLGFPWRFLDGFG